MNKKITWEYSYMLAKKYYDEHGDLLISRSFKVDGINLGTWIIHQRQMYKKGKLSEDRIKALNEIDMIWLAKEARPLKNWERMYEHAKKYYDEHGDLLIPRDYVTEDNINLGVWINCQRQLKKKGKLSKEQIKKLESIGMAWIAKDNLKSWQRMYELAEKYYIEKGHLLIPRLSKVEDISLGAWVNSQRQLKKKGKLSKEQIQKLESIGMVWIAKDNLKSWQKMYEIAKKYYIEKRNLLVPISYVTEDNTRLGAWINHQRKIYSQGKLSEERISLLENIGMVWNVHEEEWQKMYTLAKKYYIANGNLLVPGDYVTEDGVKLGLWLKEQRTAYNKGTLSKEKITLLEEIDMVWRVHIENWTNMYELAKKHYEETGSLEIQISYVTKEGIKLGAWINRQKTAYKKGELSKEKIKMLEEIGIKWNKNSFDYSWEAMYELAKEYRNQNKTLLIPGSFEVDGAKLGSWITVQRTTYKSNKLSEERTRRLNAIGMIWEVRKNKEEITLICNTYNIDININKVVLKGISALELQAKIDFLTARGIKLVYPNGKLIDIFSMSSPNMKEKYGLSLEELINIYTKDNKKVRIK